MGRATAMILLKQTGDGNMMRLLELTVLPVVWGGMLLAALSMHDMPGFSQHSVCGPWGCVIRCIQSQSLAHVSGFQLVQCEKLRHPPWTAGSVKQDEQIR